MTKASITPTRLPATTLIDNPRNPRRHPEQQLLRLSASLRHFGQTVPILARAENKMIISGHGVRQAALLAGLETVDVLLWETDQDTADAFMLAANRLHDLSEDDPERRRELLRQLGFEDVEALGFSRDEVDKLLADAADSEDLHEIDFSHVGDEFWIAIRGPLAHQAVALKRMREALADLPGITVELGVTGL